MQAPSYHTYIHYTEADFMADPYFQEWIITASEEQEHFWREFLLLYPFKKEAVEQARDFLMHLKFKEHLPSDSQIEQRFIEHLQQVNEEEAVPVINIKRKKIQRLALIAACIGGLIVIASLLLFNHSKPTWVAISTRYGEIKKVQLPDSSTIVLNAHSQIKFRGKWQKDQPREIWLDGEAFFNVTHLNRTPWNIKNGERFIVHGNDITVEVLGTSFNVRQRRGTTEVVLQSGKIALTLQDSTTRKITMTPGDLVAYNTTTKRTVLAKTIPQNYTAWKENKLLLNNPTLGEVCHYLEDNFGKKIILQDEKLANKKIEGPILMDNLDDALFIISTVLNVNIEKKDSLLIMHSK